VAPNAAAASRRIPQFGLKTAAGSRRRLPSLAAPHQLATSSSLAVLLAYFGAHAVLGIVMKKVPALATLHALLTFLVGLYFSATARQPARVIIIVSYLMAAEVLWRMTGAAIFWETGKYATSAILLLFSLRCRPPRFNRLALAYWLLLIPSVILTCVQIQDLGNLRGQLSFNASGPFALAVCAFCLWGVKLKAADLQRILLAILGPLVGAAAICTFSTASLGSGYEFGKQSNFDTAGGFGPNQVSAMLGLGMLAAFLWMHLQKPRALQRLVAIALILYFFSQAALTFSRTGIYIGIGTIVVASAFVLRDRRQLVYGIASLAVLFALGYFLVFPLLDKFTGGRLSERYAQKGFAGREDIAKGDLELALHHPLLGVGLGMAKTARAEQSGVVVAAHTEFTRLLAEHGVMGALALGALLLMGFQAWTATVTRYEKAWTASLLAFATLFMMVSGMRLVAPATAIGLAMISLRHAQGAKARRASLVPARSSFQRNGRRFP
jgi:hypothetical protein